MPRFCSLLKKGRPLKNSLNALETRLALVLSAHATALNHVPMAHGLPAPGRSFANQAPRQPASQVAAHADIKNAISVEMGMAIVSGAVDRDSLWVKRENRWNTV